MDAPDFAAILQAWEVFTASDGHLMLRARQGDDLLAARIPEACPDCHGAGEYVLDGTTFACFHMDTPTIGTALTEWWATRGGQT